jgi:hypothetical protein
MIYLCCDTNIWINISNSEEPVKLLNVLHDEINNGTITLIMPQIILKEWDRNKQDKIEKRIEEAVQSQISGLYKLSNFIENERTTFFDDESAKEGTLKVQKLVSELKEQLQKQKATLLESAKENIKLVELIFKHGNTIILDTDNESAKKVIELATEKKFPFEKDKNNFADCLIFFQFYHYLKQEGIENAHFVSSNKKDFFPSGDLHEIYKVIYDTVKGNFHKSLGEAINSSLGKEIVTENEIKQIALIARARDRYPYQSMCLACYDSDDEDDNDNAIIRRLHSILHFEETFEINDERREYGDPEQLELFEDDLITGNPKPRLSPERLFMATCDNCGSDHFLCPECNEPILVDNVEKNTTQRCENCELFYIYEEERGRKGEVEQVGFTLLREDLECERCENRFVSRGDNSNLCLECEEYYGTEN